MPDAAKEQRNQEYPRLSEAQRQELRSRLDVLPQDVFFHFLHDYVHQHGPNWIVRNPDSITESWRSKASDGVPYVRHPFEQAEMEGAHYLWTKEFLSADNFVVFLELLKRNLTEDQVRHDLDEADFNFLIYWSTLIVFFNRRHPQVLSDELVLQSSLLLGFAHKANQSRNGEKLPHGDPNSYTYQHRQRLAIYERGTSFQDFYNLIKNLPYGPDYLRLINDLQTRLPADLETHDLAANYYRPREKNWRQDSLEGTQNIFGSNPTEDQKGILGRISFGAALEQHQRRSSAFFLTVERERFSFKQHFTSLIEFLKQQSGKVNPHLRFSVNNTAEVKLITEHILDEPVSVGDNILTRASELTRFIDSIFKYATVQGWKADREKIVILLKMMSRALIQLPELADVNDYAGKEYSGEPVRMDTPEIETALAQLRKFVDQEVVRKKAFSRQLIKKNLLGKLRKDVVRRPNYPVFGIVTLATVLTVVSFLETQAPQLQWGAGLREAFTQAVTSAIAFFDGDGPDVNSPQVSGGSNEQESFASPNPTEALQSQNVEQLLADNFAYEPQNNSLEALKREGQQPIFHYEVDGQPTWAIPQRRVLYEFSAENPFQIRWTPEEMQIITGNRIAVQSRGDIEPSPDKPPTISAQVDLRQVPSSGLLIPISFSPQHRITVRVFTETSGVLNSENGGELFAPHFVISESGAISIFIPALSSTADESEPVMLMIESTSEPLRAINPALTLMMPPPIGISYMEQEDENTEIREEFLPLEGMNSRRFGSQEQHPEILPSTELQQFLIDQGFDLDHINQIFLDEVFRDSNGDPQAHSQENAAIAERAVYLEILRQMRALGFRYSNDESVNSRLSSDDIRSYIIVGKTIGLDCDGLSFVANLVAVARRTTRTSFQSGIVLAEADIDSDGFFAGRTNHAQLPLDRSLDSMPTLEVASLFPTAEAATSFDLESVIEQLQALISEADLQAINYDSVIKGLAALLVSLLAIQVARASVEKANGLLKRKKSSRKVSHLIKAIADRLEKRTSVKLIPAFQELSPLQLTQIPEVIGIILYPESYPMSPSEESKSEQLTRLLEMVEIPEHLTQERNAAGLNALAQSSKKALEARSDSINRKMAVAALNHVIDTHTAKPDVEPVFIAVRALFT